MRNILVDTGAIVALLRPDDPAHDRVVTLFASLRGTDRLLTTWPVITECSFALERRQKAFFDWLFESRLEVVDFDMPAVRSMREWTQRFRDRQIDVADATLVWLASARNTDLVLTTDYRDFRTYRLPDGRAFQLLLPEVCFGGETRRQMSRHGTRLRNPKLADVAAQLTLFSTSRAAPNNWSISDFWMMSGGAKASTSPVVRM